MNNVHKAIESTGGAADKDQHNGVSPHLGPVDQPHICCCCRRVPIGTTIVQVHMLRARPLASRYVRAQPTHPHLPAVQSSCLWSDVSLSPSRDISITKCAEPPHAISPHHLAACCCVSESQSSRSSWCCGRCRSYFPSHPCMQNLLLYRRPACRFHRCPAAPGISMYIGGLSDMMM